MARLPRITPKNIPVHIVQRGNNRQVCFASDDDRAAYVQWLKEYSQKYGVDIHAWVMMTNHIHLLCAICHPAAKVILPQHLQLFAVAKLSFFEQVSA
jgi:putative transposase